MFVRRLFSPVSEVRLRILALISCLSLFAVACGGDAETTTTVAETVAPTAEAEEVMAMDHLGDGSLGVVKVEPGEAIQIRSLNAITGDVAFF
ncbi:MAG: hypothetical protein OXM88_02995, partial [bacterium]|nr:hypothetical protein [bacterium]